MQAPPSNHSVLKEYGDTFVGVWVNEETADFELKDIVKKGDKVSVRVTKEWSLNKNVVNSHWTADVNGVRVASGQGMTGWDTSAKQIVGFGFNSLGGSGRGVIQKRGDKWFDSGMGSSRTGNVGANMTIITVVTADTHKALKIGRVSPAGEPLPNRTRTWKRVKK